MLEDKRAHLQFIQAAITRMSDASAAIKRHAIGVALAVLGSAQLSHQKVLAVAGVAITLVFALLDASYLRRERGFRGRIQLRERWGVAETFSTRFKAAVLCFLKKAIKRCLLHD